MTDVVNRDYPVEFFFSQSFFSGEKVLYLFSFLDNTR